MKIAAFINQKGECLPIYAKGKIRIYSDESGKWLQTVDLLFELDNQQTIDVVRDSLIKLLKRLEKEGCHDLIARDVRGFPLSIMDGMGFEMWRLDGAPDAYLDLIREERGRQCKTLEDLVPISEEEVISLLPLPVDGKEQEGRYHINLIRSLAASGMTSKQLLLPFIREKRCQTLEVICDHLPKWFDKELASYQMGYQVTRAEDGIIHVMISPVCEQEGVSAGKQFAI